MLPRRSRLPAAQPGAADPHGVGRPFGSTGHPSGGGLQSGGATSSSRAAAALRATARAAGEVPWWGKVRDPSPAAQGMGTTSGGWGRGAGPPQRHSRGVNSPLGRAGHALVGREVADPFPASGGHPAEVRARSEGMYERLGPGHDMASAKLGGVGAGMHRGLGSAGVLGATAGGGFGAAAGGGNARPGSGSRPQGTCAFRSSSATGAEGAGQHLPQRAAPGSRAFFPEGCPRTPPLLPQTPPTQAPRRPRGDPAPPEGPRHPEQPPSRGDQRGLTKPSLDALSQLAVAGVEVGRIEARVRGLAEEVEVPGCALGPIRTELAALEAAAHRLEAQGIDSIYTGELHTGKDEAKAQKKALLARLEALFDTVDRVFQRAKASESQAAAPPVAADPAGATQAAAATEAPPESAPESGPPGAPPAASLH